MAKPDVPYTKDNEYYTPKEFVARFGTFDYDPATTQEKAQDLGISHYDTVETDGLAQDWTPYKRIWINPPFTRKHEFMAKAWETYQQAKKVYRNSAPPSPKPSPKNASERRSYLKTLQAKDLSRS